MLPVVSGTPVLGVPLLATDKLVPEFMPPASFDRTLVEELVASVLLRTQGSSSSSLALLSMSDVLDGLDHDAALAAIGDTSFRPRLLVDLGTNALVQVEKACAAAAARCAVTPDAVRSVLRLIDWRVARDKVAERFAEMQLSAFDRRLLVQAALLQEPVRFVFPTGVLPKTPVERALQLARSFGFVELDGASHGDYCIVRMPLMQIRGWGTGDFLPAAMTDVRTK